ncbi:MAG: fused MFS/spermidine synthase [Sandaracinaceae bacterium]|nr:fused MFS/spermidine synthase [Sandaracinaceae bacterium]
MSSRSVAAYLAFFLSGTSSLIFQTIWTRMLHHVFGATSLAISTVLTVFMAGLGLGAWLGGKYANRIKHPIITYAVAEIGVGIWGLLVPLLVRSDGWLATVNAILRAEFGAESGMFMVTRFLCVAPILIIPTTLMGSTLPLLTRHFVSAAQTSQAAGARVGVLYALNTFGAATGPLLSAFLLMPNFGLSVTNIVACSMNFSLALIIFAARKPLLEGMWRPGEPLRFWPGTAEEAAPSDATEKPQPKAEPVEGDETEGFDDLRPDEAQVGAYRDAAEKAAGDDGEGAPKKKRKRKKRPATPEPASTQLTPETRRGLLIRGSLFLGLALLAGLSFVGTGGLEVVLIRIALFAMTGAALLSLVLASLDALRGDDDADAAEARADEAEPAIPELARKAAYLAFAASGAAALCYEVVWSRALAMTIGSSIYSFSLILETFLIGIAGGSAAMSAFMGSRSSPFVGIGITSAALVLFANVPWAVDIVDPSDVQHRFHGSILSYVLLSLCYIAPIAIGVVWITLRMRRKTGDEAAFRDDLAVWKPLLTVAIASLPVVAAGFNAGHFPGFLPQILLSVVACVAVFLIVGTLLARTPTLLVAVMQLFIAGATVVSYYWQDEIPYAFAQLVAGIPTSALPDKVGMVQLFMFMTIVLCTLPSTLGMGAMFPLTVRIWTAGGNSIAKDVAVVYTGNTFGSIIGSWLPGFILFALVGAEHTLHLGIALNMILALVLLIAGAADPSEDQSWWTWRRVAAVGLPALTAIIMGVDAWSGGLDHPELATRVGSCVGFIALAAVEYQWLRRCDSEGRPSMPIAAALAGVPLVSTIALALYLASPGVTEEWALQAVVLALKAFLFFVGAALAWANWREWSSSETPAAPAPEGA